MDEVELAKELIAFDTTSPIYEGEIFAFLENVLQERGVSSTIHSINGVKSLTARTGEGDTRICFNGHLDVVEPGDNWQVTAPFHPRVQDGRLYGRGASDMKSGMAAMIMAFLDLQKDPSFDAELTLMATGDEERAGIEGTRALLEKECDYDYAIVGEPTGLDIQVGTRGMMWVDIILQGELGHSSRPHLVHNVVEDLPRIIGAIESHEMQYHANPNFPKPTMPITVVSTDLTRNTIPGNARIGLDVRYLPSQDPEKIVADLEADLDSLGIDFRIEYEDQGGAFELADEDLKQAATDVLEELRGDKPAYITEGGNSDGRFFAEHGVPHIELGVEQRTAHQRDENCRVNDIMQLRKAYRGIAKRLAE